MEINNKLNVDVAETVKFNELIPSRLLMELSEEQLKQLAIYIAQALKENSNG